MRTVNQQVKTLKATKTKILSKLKTLDALIQTLLDEMDRRLEVDNKNASETVCVFASPQLPFPWREEPVQDVSAQ
jgi:hypothetical protein